MGKIQILVLMLMLFMTIGVLHFYWVNEFEHYIPVQESSMIAQVGSNISLEASLLQIGSKPAFIHFFDNECILSKTNIEHLNLFLPDFQRSFEMYLIVAGDVTVQDLKRKYDLPTYIKVINDPTRQLFDELGVKATPQAMIIETDQKVLFRGNYSNGNGLCAPSNIKYSAPAIALLKRSRDKPLPFFPTYQTQQWGCKL